MHRLVRCVLRCSLAAIRAVLVWAPKLAALAIGLGCLIFVIDRAVGKWWWPAELLAPDDLNKRSYSAPYDPDVPVEPGSAQYDWLKACYSSRRRRRRADSSSKSD